MTSDYPHQESVAEFKPNSTMAVISLVAGILGLTLVPIAGSIVAIITGFMARNEIKASEGALGGDGLATGGLVLGFIGVGLAVLGLCFASFIIGIPICISLGLIVSEYSGILLPMFMAM
jgi:hypothetical protein